MILIALFLFLSWHYCVLYILDYIENAVTVLICKNDYVEEQVEIPEFGPRTKKHLKQVSSLIGIMEKYELFQPDTCYIELGAGKGIKYKFTNYPKTVLWPWIFIEYDWYFFEFNYKNYQQFF